MQVRYTYKGDDITLDLLFKIEHIANILAEKEGKDFDAAFVDFIESNTYRKLQQTNNLLWAESSEYIVDEYLREKVANVPTFAAALSCEAPAS